MTITKDDIKILASERLTDDADGGGFMSPNVIVDGVENNLFPDISDLDRAQGAVDYRKVFPAVLSNTSEAYYGANVIIDQLPADTNVTGLLVKSTGIAEKRADLIERLNDNPDSTSFYGTKPLSANALLNDRSVKVNGTDVRFIPTSSVGAPVSGSVATEGSQATADVLIPMSATANATPFLTDYPFNAGKALNFWTNVIPGSVGGTYTDAGSAVVNVSDTQQNGVPYLAFNGTPYLGTNFIGSNYKMGHGAWLGSPSIPAGTTNNVVFKPAAMMTLPAELYQYVWPAGSPVSVTLTLPHQSEAGSESIEWTAASDGYVYRLVCYGPGAFSGVEGVSGSINRTTRQVTLVFATGKVPKVGTSVSVKYVRKGYAQPLASSAVSGPFSAYQVTINSTSGYSLREAFFKIGGQWHHLEDGVVYNNIPLPGFERSVVGSYDRVNRKITMLVPDGTTITDWFACEVSDAFPGSALVDASMPAGLDPASVVISGVKAAGGAFSATADSSGTFSTSVVTGSYNSLTGKVNLTFSEPVAIESLTYEGDQQTYTPVGPDVAGVDPTQFPVTGAVPAYKEGDLVVVHNTQSLAPQTVTNGQTVNCGRTMLADVRVFGNDGVEITTGFTFSRTAGTVTFSDITGYVMPVTIKHRIEDMALAISVDPTGLIGLSRPLSHAYTAGVSYVSSALVLGDLFGRAHDGFTQASWLNNWLDEAEGADILASYNEAAYPIQVSDKGGVTERWAVIFTSSTAFRVIGEQIGQIAVGDTTNPCSPINPATGAPYFTIPALGWGGGWAIGNVYRFNTTGGSAPLWVIRSIAPSAPFEGQDKLAIAVRGSINA